MAASTSLRGSAFFALRVIISLPGLNRGFTVITPATVEGVGA